MLCNRTSLCQQRLYTYEAHARTSRRRSTTGSVQFSFDSWRCTSDPRARAHRTRHENNIFFFIVFKSNDVTQRLYLHCMILFFFNHNFITYSILDIFLHVLRLFTLHLIYLNINFFTHTLTCTLILFIDVMTQTFWIRDHRPSVDLTNVREYKM